MNIFSNYNRIRKSINDKVVHVLPPCFFNILAFFALFLSNIFQNYNQIHQFLSIRRSEFTFPIFRDPLPIFRFLAFFHGITFKIVIENDDFLGAASVFSTFLPLF